MLSQNRVVRLAVRLTLHLGVLVAAAACAASARRDQPIELTYPHAGFGRVGCFAGPALGYNDSTVPTSLDNAAASGPWLVLDSISIAEWKRVYSPRNPGGPWSRLWTLITRVDSIEGTRVVGSRMIKFRGAWRRVTLDSVAFNNAGASLAPTAWRLAVSSADVRGTATMSHDIGTTLPSGEFVRAVSNWRMFGLRIPCTRVPLVNDARPSYTHVDEQTLRASLSRLNSTDSSTRMKAYDAMVGFLPDLNWYAADATAQLLRDHARDRKRIATALIALLERENAIVNATAEDSQLTPYALYHDRLITSVAVLYDPAAIPALLGAIGPASSAADALAGFGARTIPGLVQTLTSTRRLARWGAVSALSQMISRARELTLTRENLDRIRVALIAALGDSYMPVRHSAILALNAFDDADTRRAIERVAEADADHDIRKEAAAWLTRHRSRDA